MLFRICYFSILQMHLEGIENHIYFNFFQKIVLYKSSILKSLRILDFSYEMKRVLKQDIAMLQVFAFP